jgi:phage terminase small subunit
LVDPAKFCTEAREADILHQDALRNIRYEIFAQEIAKGVSHEEAFVIAGFTPNPSNARRLKLHKLVVQRVQTILENRYKIADRKDGKAVEKAAEALAIDKQWVMGAMVENALIALGRKSVVVTKVDRKTGQPRQFEVTMRDAAAANRSLELLGREFRMWIERKEIGEAGEFERMNEHELRNFLIAEAEALRLGPPGTEEKGDAGDPGGSRRLN